MLQLEKHNVTAMLQLRIKEKAKLEELVQYMDDYIKDVEQRNNVLVEKITEMESKLASCNSMNKS